MKKLLILSLTCVVLMIGFLPVVRADEVTDTFLGANGNIPNVNLIRGTGPDVNTHYRGTSNVSPDIWDSRIVLSFPVYADSISQVSITFDAVGGSCVSNRTTSLSVTDGTITTTYANKQIGTCGNGETTLTWTGFVDNPTTDQPLGVWMSVARRIVTPGSASNYVRLKSVSVTYIELGTTPTEGTVPEGLIRPLTADDEEEEFGVYESEEEEESAEKTVIAFSENVGDYVLNAGNGIVEVVEPLTSQMCKSRLRSGSVCLVPVPESVTGEDEHEYRVILGEISGTDFSINAYRVVVADTENGVEFEYFVADAPQYVNVGDTINAGCYLGKTFEILPIFGGANRAVTVVTALDSVTGDPMTLLPALNVYGILENACNIDPAFSTCIGDADLSDPTQWTESGPVNWQNPGILLGSNGRISQTMNLNQSEEQSLTVGARLISFSGGTANVRLQLGSEVRNTSITQFTQLNELMEYRIPLDFYNPDVGTFYTISITAAGNFQIEILYACVTQGDDAPGGPASQCYFSNHSFDYGTTDWNPMGGPIAGFGYVTMDLDSEISQEVHLFPNEDDSPHVYTVWITYGPHFDLYQEPNFDFEYTVEFKYPSSEAWEAVGATVTDNGAIFGHSFTFEVDSEITDDFAIRVNFTAGNSTLLGVRIYDICIRPPYPQQNTFGGDWFFTYSCSYVSKPSGTQQLSDWTEYHWLQLKRFFDCDLMTLLRRIEISLNNFFKTILWAVRYWMSLLVYWAQWLATDLFPWLNGHFHNMAIGQTTFITTGSESCGNIFCFFTDIFATGGSVFSDLINAIQGIFNDIASVLQSLINQLGGLLSQIVAQILAPIINTILGIINQAVSMLLTIVTGIVGIAFSLLNLVFAFFNQLLGLVNTIVTAWNTATPTAIPGLPTCAIDPQSNGICIGLWMMENTIFSGTGALLIPLIIGYSSIMLILWAIGTFKKTLMETAQAL